MKEYADYYFRKAKAENYPARSVYKLKEIDARYKLLRQGMRVLDLGAAPGSWSLDAAKKVGSRGLVLACDLQEAATPFPPQVIFMRENIFEPGDGFLARLKDCGPFDLVMSDMAPATTGNRFTDQCRSAELVRQAFEIAQEHSAPGANFVAKIFMGSDMEAIVKDIRKKYKSVKTFKPKSSRPESKEIFIIGLNLGMAAAQLSDAG